MGGPACNVIGASTTIQAPRSSVASAGFGHSRSWLDERGLATHAPEAHDIHMTEPPNLRLVVRYPDEHEASYPLEYGRYQIGTSESCEIRIDGPSTTPGLLRVDSDGVWLRSLGGTASDADVWQRIAPYDCVSLGTLELELLPSLDTAQLLLPPSSDVSPELFRQAEDDLRMGLAGYRRFRERLFMRIAPTDADEARRAFYRSAILLWPVLVVLLGLTFLNLSFGTQFGLPRFNALSDGLGALLILSALVLGAWFHVPTAGRLLLTSYGVVLALWVGTLREFVRGGLEWDHFTFWMDLLQFSISRTIEGPAHVIFLIVSAPLVLAFYGLGALFDYGASSLPYRSHPRRRRCCLAGWGLIWILFPLTISASELNNFLFDASQPSPITRSAGVLCLLYACCPARWFERWTRRLHSPGAFLVFQAAHPRSLRHWGGWAIAVALSIFPFWIFLNCLDLRDRLAPDTEVQGTTSNDPLLHSPGRTPAVWFWATQGRLLRRGDLASPTIDLYGISPAQYQTPESWSAALWYGMPRNQQGDPAYREAYQQIGLLTSPPGWSGQFLPAELHRRMREILMPFRIRTEEEFNRLVIEARPDDPLPTWLAFEQLPPTGAASSHSQWAYAEALHAWSLPESWARSFGTFYWWFLSLSLLAICALGFLFLWRRGGDSPLARWIGVGLLAHAGAVFYWFADYFTPAILHHLNVYSVSAHHTSDLLTVALTAQILITKSLRSSVTYVDLPLCVIWVHLFWPARARAPMVAWRQHALTGVKVTTVGIALFVATRSLNDVYSFFGMDVDVLRAVRPEMALLVAAGYLIRRRTFGGATEPRTGWLFLLALLVLIDGPGLMQVGLDPYTMSPTLFWIGLGLAAVGLVLFVPLLRQNVLRVVSVREFSYVAMVLVVPAAVVVVEEIAKDVFKRVPSISDRGTELVAIAGVVAVLPLIHRTIELGAGRLFVPRLPLIEREIDRVLEAVVDADTQDDRRATVAQLFDRLGITGYAFYARGRQGVFQLHLHRLSKSPVESICLSPSLRDFLAERHTFMDLYSVPFEWKYFFHQFELYQLERTTGCRHLLPICLGNSMRGLLLLPHGLTEDNVSRHPTATEFGSLGIAAIST